MEDLAKYLENNKKIEIKKISKEKFNLAFYQLNNSDIVFFYNNEKVNFEKYEKVNIYIYTKEGIFFFETKVITTTLKLIKVQKPNLIKKIQRRQLFRENLEIKVNVSFHNKKITEDIVNISGGGISFNTNENLKGVEKIDLSFEIEGKTIKTLAQIIEIRKNIKNPKMYRIGAKFIALNNCEIEYIIKNCIKHQIKNL